MFSQKRKEEEIEISEPSGFRHESHITFDQDMGFTSRNIPSEWKRLFQAAGVRKRDLKNPETYRAIMAIINKPLKFSEEKVDGAFSNPRQPITQKQKPVPEIPRRASLNIGSLHPHLAVPTIPYYQLKFKKTDRLGEGGFGIVYQGTWLNNAVAIKQLKIIAMSNEATEEFSKEAAIMAGLRHPNIVQFYGISIDSFGRYSMVMEYMPKGSLYSVLHSQKSLEWSIRYKIAIDIASGLTLLHSKEILYRDLKSLNVLLDDQMRAKLTDFGLSIVKNETSSAVSETGDQSVGTLSWIAPELFQWKIRYTTRSDIYSYGMVLWELASRKVPFAEVVHPFIIMENVKKGAREIIPPNCPLSFAQLIKWCWKQDPASRPVASQLVEKLVQISQSVNQPEGIKTSSTNLILSSTAPSYQGNLDPTIIKSAPGYRFFSEASDGRRTTDATRVSGTPLYSISPESSSDPNYQYNSQSQ